MKATLGNTEIYYDIAGLQLEPKGMSFVEKPVLFLLHGGPGGDHLRYKQHSLDLQKVAQLVFIDHRGCGRSKKTRQKDYTLDNNVEDIEALRKHLGLERICILGTSYGGMVAQGYAMRYPKRVEKLILVVTAPSYRFIAEAQAYLHENGSPKQIASAEPLWNGRFKNRAHVKQFFTDLDPLYSVSLKKKSKKGFANTIWSVEALNEGFGNFLQKFDFVPKLKKISCPTLILAGDQDWICRPNQSKIMAKHIPKAALKIFKNCGHALASDSNAAYIKAVNRFLKVKKNDMRPR